MDDKFEEIEASLGSSSSLIGRKGYEKLESRLMHVLGRIDRMSIETEGKAQLEDNTNSTDDDDSVSNASGSGAHDDPNSNFLIRYKSTPVRCWDLKFLGDKKGTLVNAFLERVDELCLARHVTFEELFNFAIDLFVIWYRAVRCSVTDWQSLPEQLRD
ncbi:hypothetical protein RN001_000085 [Aquatica leii]|uniref:Uncharacterized protein n=1 Tax=Aquatica leii TaxID=1421715 RepID=A0AAN7SKA8_9COLE|nr:hypothetical protein RN001_000085 [Aquatica leii]